MKKIHEVLSKPLLLLLEKEPAYEYIHLLIMRGGQPSTHVSVLNCYFKRVSCPYVSKALFDAVFEFPGRDNNSILFYFNLLSELTQTNQHVFFVSLNSKLDIYFVNFCAYTSFDGRENIVIYFTLGIIRRNMFNCSRKLLTKLVLFFVF